MADPEPGTGAPSTTRAASGAETRPPAASVPIDVSTLRGRDRHALLTSLVVPRPIAWVSTWGPEGRPNLAPFSYFAALSASPMLVGISIGARRGQPKDTLVNLRASGALCINVVSEDHLEAMNATSADVAPDVDEFVLAHLDAAPSSVVDAPYVPSSPAVLECAVRNEMALPGGLNTLVIAEVLGARLEPRLLPAEGHAVDPEQLRPVGRLGGAGYMLPGAFRYVPRP